MESNTALIRAASGLEKLMLGRQGIIIKDSNVAQISAAIYYQSQVLGRLMENEKFQDAFKNTVYFQIEKDFGEYVDALARVKPKSLHHVYEWKRVGQKDSRLFKISRLNSDGLSLRLSYEFIPSQAVVPSKIGKRRHVFANKASVMEEGKPLVISPRYAERLVFESDGVVTFMPKGKSVTVRRPGGTASTNQFALAYGRFFSGNLVSDSIKRSGFQNLFSSSLVRAMKLPADIKRVKYSFSPNKLIMEANASTTAAFGVIA